MGRQRPALGTPFGADGPWLAAILDTLGDIHDLLDDRLPKADSGRGEPVRVEEPATPAPPVEVVPIQEPAPVKPPAVEEDDDDDGEVEPVEIAEPAPAPRPSPTPPPRGGPGSGLPAWQQFADDAKVAYPPDANRDDIIAACERAGVIERK